MHRDRLPLIDEIEVLSLNILVELLLREQRRPLVRVHLEEAALANSVLLFRGIIAIFDRFLDVIERLPRLSKVPVRDQESATGRSPPGKGKLGGLVSCPLEPCADFPDRFRLVISLPQGIDVVLILPRLLDILDDLVKLAHCDVSHAQGHRQLKACYHVLHYLGSFLPLAVIVPPPLLRHLQYIYIL